VRILKKFVTLEEYFALEGLWRGAASLHSWPVTSTPGRSRHYTFTASMYHSKELEARCLKLLPRNTGDGLHYVDAFFLYYLPGDHVEVHTDARTGHRLNVLLTRPEEGGELVIGGKGVNWSPTDAVVFRPDREPHEVRKVLQGVRLVWSIGRCRSPAVTERPYPKQPPDV